MLVSNFKMNSRLENTLRHFSGINGMSLTRMHKKEKEDDFCISGIGKFKLLLLPNRSTSNRSCTDSSVIL